MPASAVDHLGPHLLGRKPMPPDPRDYKLETFLSAYDRMAARGMDTGGLSPDTTLADLVKEFGLTSWHDVYAFWHWLQANVISPAGPQPGPEPGPPPAPTPPAKPAGGWHDAADPTLDQGQTPHCIGFTGADEGNAGAPDRAYRDPDGHRLYYQCEPGDVGKPIDQQQGSDIRTLCKVLQQQKVIGAYAFASELATIEQFIAEHGAIMIGTNWTDGMFTPDAHNYIEPTGAVAGGHAYSLVDHLPEGTKDVPEATFKLLNHWSSDWGEGGYAYIRADDLWSLIESGGDAAAGLRAVT